MSIFSAVGDFFRTPFESDEETRKRKERERLESQQRAAQKLQAKQQQAKQTAPGSPFVNKPTSPVQALPQAQPASPIGTILNSQVSNAPRIQESQQKPQGPKQSLGNKFRDLFDANTEADKFRREQQGRARDFRESNDEAGQRTYNNPVQRIGYELVKPVAQGVNTIASATHGIYQQSENIKDLMSLRDQYKRGEIDKATYDQKSKEIAARGENARFGGKGGILGLGGYYDKTSDLEDKKKLAGTILQTGGALSQVIPEGKALEAGIAGRELLQKEIFQNVTGGIASEGGRQVSEGKFDPKALVVEGVIDVATPVGLHKLGGIVEGLRSAGVPEDAVETTAKKIARSKDPKESQAAIDDALKKAKKETPEPEVKPKEGVSTPDVVKNVEREATKVDTPTAKQIGVEELNTRTSQEIEAIKSDPRLTPEEKAARTDTVMQQYQKVNSELKASLEKTKQVTDENARGIQAKQEQLSQDIAEVNKPTKVEAPAGDSPAPVAPEQAANDAAYKDVGDIIYKNAPAFEERGMSLPQTLSPDRLIREKITNPIENAVTTALNKASTSDNSIARGFSRLVQGFSKEAVKTPEQLAAERLMRGGIETGKLYRERITNIGKNVEDESKRRIWASLDPDQAAKVGVKQEVLSEAEAYERAKLKDVIDTTTEELRKRGLITPEQAANEGYIKRGYEVFEKGSDFQQAADATRSGLLKQFAQRGEVDEKLLDQAITDPYYLVAKKTAESQAAMAMYDYGDWLSKNGIAQDMPGPGRVQMPTSKVYGPAAGKWVPKSVLEDFSGFQYTNGMLSAYDNLVSQYDSLGIRKGKKALLTVANPAVRFGNQFSNRAVFSSMNGINPVQFNAVYTKIPGLMKEGNQLYREAVAQGLVGTDLTQADFARTIAGYTDDNVGKKALNWVKDSYSAADDKAKVTAYVVHRSRGYSPEEAARLTQRGFQDYNSVGFFYDLAAKTPIIGNAFVRFAGDSIRIAKNAALDHPLRSAATIAMWATFVNTMSKLSGESAADKKTREDRFGAPKIPFTDISMTVQSPWGEFNVARFLPFYQLNDIQNPLTKVLPVGQNPLKPEGWQDPLLGQVLSIAADKDFRGKSIRDPEDVKFADGTSKFQMDPLSDKDKRNNVLRFLFTQNAPLGRETDSLVSAARGKEDIYGKERSVKQAVLRALGIKVEQFGHDQADKARGTEEYYKRKEEVDKEVGDMTPAAQAAYRRLTGMYKLRDEKTNPFDPNQTINVKAPVYDFSEQKYGEYMQNPQLFDVMEKKAQQEAAANGAPLKPEFDPRLPKNFRLQLIQQKSIAPGDDIELQERMYADPLWDTYQAIKDEYSAKAKQYYPESNGEFTDEMVKHQDAPFPKKPALWQAYTDAKNRGEDPGWSDAVQAARTDYENAKLNWTNNERAARGLPAIPAEVWFNKTFGYTPDNGKGGFGFGGKKGSYNNDWGKLGELLNASPVKRLEDVSPQELPALVAVLKKLQAGGGGGRKKPTLGASSRGQA